MKAAAKSEVRPKVEAVQGTTAGGGEQVAGEEEEEREDEQEVWMPFRVKARRSCSEPGEQSGMNRLFSKDD